MAGDALDLLVASRSCFVSINRAPYRELAKRGLRVAIVVPRELTFGGHPQKAEPREADDPPIYELESTGGHGRLWTFRGIRNVLRRNSPRIVLLDTDPGSRLSIEVGLYQRMRKRKTACISCDNMPHTLLGELRRGPRDGAKFLAARALSRLSASVVDHVFCLTSDILDVNRRKGFDSHLSIMRLGFDPAIFFPDARVRDSRRHELGIASAPCIGYFGRISQEKGLHVLLGALELLLDLDWFLLLDRFTTYGSQYAEQMRAQIQERLGGRVREFDASHSEIASYMNATDIVVVPSISSPGAKEQYGRVVPEAMACGNVLVVSNSGALPEIAGDAAVIVPEGSAQELARELRKLLTNENLRRAYSSRSVIRAQAFTISQQAKQLLDVFRTW